MKDLGKIWAARESWLSPHGREESIMDYLLLTNQLVVKRQVSLAAGVILAAFYFNPITVFVFYAFIGITEFFDIMLARHARAWDCKDQVTGRKILKRIAINTVLSAIAVTAFSVNMAVQQPSSGHFTPLFFLFSASVFAAMYNSQMIGILLLRLSIYGCGFLYIALLDVLRFMPPIGSHIWLQFFTIIFVLYFISDISIKFYLSYQERVQQMNLIREENERTKAALEVKSRFLATVSHELRTPLTSIVGSLELMKNDSFGLLPDPLKPVMSIAARNAQRLSALIEDLLDMQKIEAGEMVFRFEPIDANDLVEEAMDSTAGYASKLGIHVMSDPCVDPCRINGDRNRLVQVMSNLLSNALKFSNDNGAVHVRVENLNGRIRISVQDAGVGIPDGAKDCVFGKFSQVDSSDVRKVGGTGLGLNITKQIVERHNAIIDYDSELGVGSTFYIEFDPLSKKTDLHTDPKALAKAA